jgi:hypothetical protein
MEIAGANVPWAWAKQSENEHKAKFRVTDPETGKDTHYTVVFMRQNGRNFGLEPIIWTMAFFYGSEEEVAQAIQHNWQDRPGDTKQVGVVFGTVGAIVRDFIMSGVADGLYVVPGSESLARIYATMTRRMGGTFRKIPGLGAIYIGR